MTPDPLDFLRRVQPVEFHGTQIYGEGNETLYLVVEGLVKVSHLIPGRDPVIIDLYPTDSLFGESALVGGHPHEIAEAIGAVKVMSWPITVIEGLIARNPELGIALVRVAAQRQVDFAARIEGLVSQCIEQRLIAALIHFGERFGTKSVARVELPPLMHKLLAQYVGTSREIVTHYMVKLRNAGLIRYSRRELSISTALGAPMAQGVAA